jgi:hypothetical protein
MSAPPVSTSTTAHVSARQTLPFNHAKARYTEGG